MSRSFTPRGRGAPRGGGDRGRGGYGGRGGGRGGFQRSFDQGPPAEVLEMGTFVHAVEGEMLCASSNAAKVPYFNAPIYLENKSSIGKVDEILGPINEVYFTIKPQEGIVAGSFKKGDKVYIGGDKLLPLDRFIPKPKIAGPKPPKKKGTRGGPGRIPGGGGRGGRGGGRGSFRGAPRGRGGFGGDRGRGGFGRGAPRGRGGGFRGRGRGS